MRGWNNRDSKKLLRYLREAKQKHSSLQKSARQAQQNQKPTSQTASRPSDKRFVRKPAEGGLVLNVFTRVLDAEYAAPSDRFKKIFRESTGRDHLWITKDEVKKLAKGTLPPAVAMRIARFHCIDNSRGEPPMWRTSEVSHQTMTLKEEDGGYRLEGEVRIHGREGQRSFNAAVLGHITSDGSTITRFDFVIRGDYTGAGRYTSVDVPKGSFTLGIAATIASPDDPSYAVPPQGMRDARVYLRADR